MSRLRRILLATEKVLINLKWGYFTNPKASKIRHSAELLVVKKEIYADIAKICIQSFLYWNREAVVSVHCDDHTFSNLKKWNSSNRFKSRIQILNTYRGDIRNWQDIKLEVLLSLSGSHTFFMDADLRWNAPLLIQTSAPTFLVKEFKLKNRAPYKQIIENNSLNKYLEASMWNTSFFTFSGFKISEEQMREIQEIHLKLLQIIQGDDIGRDDKSSLVRLAEQLAISIAAQSWEVRLDSLKEVDGFKDGSFLESSYFGATGATF
jgi:hypothetical protein